MKLKKIRNALLVVLTLALVSATAVAVTWAYTEGNFGSAENTFTNEDIAAELTEWEWDGDKSTVDSTSTHQINDKTTSTLGMNIAKSYSPSQTIPKNPSISNISDTSENSTDDPKEWVAMTVRYYILSGTDKYYFSGYSTFSEALATVHSDVTSDTGFNTSNWDAKGGSDNTVFYYNSIINNKAMTATIFDDVIVNSKTALDAKKAASGDNAGKYVYTGLKKVSGATVSTDQTFVTATLPEFHIELQGYAVQADNVDYSTAKTELDKLIAADPITILLG